MNIQIFGTKKCNDTKKAERFFKERGIRYQFIDMKEKGISKGEFNSVAQVNGGLDNMINWEGKDKDLLALIKYTADEDKLEKVLENLQVIKTLVVRNGKQSTLGYQLFYLCSRGLSREEAERMVARARIDALNELVADEAVQKQVQEFMNQKR